MAVLSLLRKMKRPTGSGGPFSTADTSMTGSNNYIPTFRNLFSFLFAFSYVGFPQVGGLTSFPQAAAGRAGGAGGQTLCS
jgi:hypothetical protein